MPVEVFVGGKAVRDALGCSHNALSLNYTLWFLNLKTFRKNTVIEMHIAQILLYLGLIRKTLRHASLDRYLLCHASLDRYLLCLLKVILMKNILI